MNSFFRNIPPVTKNLLIINVIVWLICALMPSFGHTLNRVCALHYFISPDFRFWQPITYMFMHAGFTHIFFNMFGVVMFGATIERVFGSARYLLFYLTVGVGAALVQEGVYAIWISNLAKGLPDGLTLSAVADEGARLVSQGMNWVQEPLASLNLAINTPTVGASGSLYGILLAFAMLFPNMPIYLYFLVPIKAKWLVLGFGLLELFFGITGIQSTVAHFAHLGGMIVALLLIIYWRKKGEINRGPLY